MISTGLSPQAIAKMKPRDWIMEKDGTVTARVKDRVIYLIAPDLGDETSSIGWMESIYTRIHFTNSASQDDYIFHRLSYGGQAADKSKPMCDRTFRGVVEDLHIFSEYPFELYRRADGRPLNEFVNCMMLREWWAVEVFNRILTNGYNAWEARQWIAHQCGLKIIVLQNKIESIDRNKLAKLIIYNYKPEQEYDPNVGALLRIKPIKKS